RMPLRKMSREEQLQALSRQLRASRGEGKARHDRSAMPGVAALGCAAVGDDMPTLGIPAMQPCLMTTDIALARHGMASLKIGPLRVNFRAIDAPDAGGVAAPLAADAFTPYGQETTLLQIGRASCREIVYGTLVDGATSVP